MWDQQAQQAHDGAVFGIPCGEVPMEEQRLVLTAQPSAMSRGTVLLHLWVTDHQYHALRFSHWSWLLPDGSSLWLSRCWRLGHRLAASPPVWLAAPTHLLHIGG